MAKYLDEVGVAHLWEKSKDYIGTIAHDLQVETTQKVSAAKTELNAAISTEAQNREQGDIDTIALIAKLHATFSGTCTPTIMEKGVSTNVKINTSAVFDGAPLTYTTTVNGSPLVTSGYNVTDTTTFTVVLNIDNADPKLQMTKSFSPKITAYYPKYYGVSNKSSLTTAELDSLIADNTLVKQAIASGVGGKASFTITGEDKYFWFCVPSGMTITKVTNASGFAVDLTKTTVTVTGKGSYNCYRSTKIQVPGSYTCTIS